MIDLTERKVSASEFFSLLFLSVLSTVFMYISSPQIPIARTEALLRPVVFIIISLVAGLPAYFIYINNVKNVIKAIRNSHPYEEPAIDIVPLIDETLFN